MYTTGVSYGCCPRFFPWLSSSHLAVCPSSHCTHSFAGASNCTKSTPALPLQAASQYELQLRFKHASTSVVLASTVKTALLGLHMGAGSRVVGQPAEKARSREQQDALLHEPGRSACSGVSGQCSLLVQMF